MSRLPRNSACFSADATFGRGSGLRYSNPSRAKSVPLPEAGLRYAAWPFTPVMSSCCRVVAMARPRRRAPARWDTEPRAGAFAGHRPARRSPGNAPVNDSLGCRKPSPNTIGFKSWGVIASGPRMPSRVAAGAEGASRIGPGLGRVATISPVALTASDTAGPTAPCLQARFTTSATSELGMLKLSSTDGLPEPHAGTEQPIKAQADADG